MRIVEKLWGQERILHNSLGYCMKELTVNFGWRSSLHMHAMKTETFLVVEGGIELELGENTLRLMPKDYVTVFPGQWHRFTSVSGRSIIIEASTEHSDEDVFRKEQSGRA